jgi:hypothetical protein
VLADASGVKPENTGIRVFCNWLAMYEFALDLSCGSKSPGCGDAGGAETER